MRERGRVPAKCWNRRQLLRSLGLSALGTGALFNGLGCFEPRPAPIYQGLTYKTPAPLPPDLDARARAILRWGAKWLWSQQEGDGSFRSRVYEDLSTGEVCTPFVLDALVRIPRGDFPLPKDQASRGLEWILRRMDRRGALGVKAAVPLYVAHSTAYALKAFAALRPSGWRNHLSQTVAWLESLQVLEEEVAPLHPAIGSFIEGQPRASRKTQILLVDLGCFRVIVEALAEYGREPGTGALLRAQNFVETCKTGDGGFLYSPVNERLNKGLRTKRGAIAGYGTATADGILSMAALGQGLGSRGLDEALLFLQRAHLAHEVPGIDQGRLRTYAEGLKGYYRAGAAQCFARFGGTKTWREDLITVLAEEQTASGRWFNRNRVQREDDPLIATAHALKALSAILEVSPKSGA